MTSTKRPFEIISIDDSDGSEAEVLLTRPTKVASTRTTGTHRNPIDLVDPDLDDGLAVPRPMLNPDMMEPFTGRDAFEYPTHGVHRNRRVKTEHPVEEPDLFTTARERHLRDQGFLDELGSPGTMFTEPSVPAPEDTLYRYQNTHQDLSEGETLAQVLEMFPDVAHDHALSVIQEQSGSLTQTIDNLMESADYPKEKDKQAARKRARQAAEIDDQDVSHMFEGHIATKLRSVIVEVLKAEFPKIPVGFIKIIQTDEKTLYSTYRALNKAQHTEPPPYSKGRVRKDLTINFRRLGMRFGIHETEVADLEKQYKFAKRECEEANARDRKEAARKRQDELMAEQCRAIGAVAECTVCFDEIPHNLMVRCNQDTPHFICFECALGYIKSEVGQSRCRLSCPASSRCDGRYTESQLRLVPNTDSLVDQLLRLQQEQDIRDAGIDDIESCPFCDFKTVCPPIETDFEFRCTDSECGIVSCRKCRQEGHIPDTCDEALRKRTKDAGLYQRHKIEEAMSEALKRTCNKCKKPFVKLDGCNKMTCPGCGNNQCYVCGKDVRGYEHFGRNKCPHTDDVEARHTREVEEAQKAAQAKVTEENPDIHQDLLEIKVSDLVQKAEDEAKAKRQRMGRYNNPLLRNGDEFGVGNRAEHAHQQIERLAHARQLRARLEGMFQGLQRNIDLDLPHIDPVELDGARPAQHEPQANIWQDINRRMQQLPMPPALPPMLGFAQELVHGRLVPRLPALGGEAPHPAPDAGHVRRDINARLDMIQGRYEQHRMRRAALADAPVDAEVRPHTPYPRPARQDEAWGM